MGTPSRVGQEELLRSAYRDAGVAAGAGRLRRGARHRHARRRPGRVGALGAVLGEGRHAGQPRLRRLGQDQHRPHRRRGGRRRPDQGGAGAAPRRDSRRACIAASRTRRSPGPTCRFAIARRTQRLAERGDRPRVGRRQRVRHRRHQRARRARGSAAAAAAAADPWRRAARRRLAAAVGAQSAEALARAGGALRRPARDATRQRRSADVCWNAATRRTALSHRARFVAADARVPWSTRCGASPPARRRRRRRAVRRRRASHGSLFVVPGQGAQWVGMARELLAREPVFRDALGTRATRPRGRAPTGRSSSSCALEPDAAGYRLDQIDVIQPVLVALAIAYAALWRSLGIEPDAVVGHSMGEVAAAHIAGVLDLDQAMRIICRRSALMRRTSGHGAMALVELSMDEARARLRRARGRVSVAVSNSPRSSVISGDPDAVDAVHGGARARRRVLPPGQGRRRLAQPADGAARPPSLQRELAASRPQRGASRSTRRCSAAAPKGTSSTPPTGRATCASRCCSRDAVGAARCDDGIDSLHRARSAPGAAAVDRADRAAAGAARDDARLRPPRRAGAGRVARGARRAVGCAAMRIDWPQVDARGEVRVALPLLPVAARTALGRRRRAARCCRPRTDRRAAPRRRGARLAASRCSGAHWTPTPARIDAAPPHWLLVAADAADGRAARGRAGERGRRGRVRSLAATRCRRSAAATAARTRRRWSWCSASGKRGRAVPVRCRCCRPACDRADARRPRLWFVTRGAQAVDAMHRATRVLRPGRAVGRGSRDRRGAPASCGAA